MDAADYGAYRCVASNALGHDDGVTFLDGNQIRMPVIAASPHQVPKSVGAEGDFGHFR